MHYTEEGLELIKKIMSQMNNQRLSSSDLPIVDRAEIRCYFGY